MSEIESSSPRRGTGRRRPAAAASAAPTPERSRAYRKMVNPFENPRIYSDDQVAAIHVAALTLLENQGMKVLSAIARKRYAQAGATVDEATQVVRIDRGLVAKALATTPSAFTFQALDPEFNTPVGGKHVCLAPTSGPPNIMDTQNGRRAGTFVDFCNLMKLSQSFDVIHTLGGAVEPQDIPVHVRHFETTRSMLLLSDKTPFIFSRGSQQIADCFELIRIAHRLSADEFTRKPYVWTVINTNSPLQLDIPMAEGIIDFAEAGQVLIITPFTLAGAMAPVTITGALTLAHAEALAGITLAQSVRPGTPILYGSFTSNVDMIGLARIRHAGVRQGRLRRRPAGALHQGAVAFLQRNGLQCAGRAGRLRGADEPVGCADGRREFHAARGGLGGRRALEWYEESVMDIEMLQMFAECSRPWAPSRSTWRSKQSPRSATAATFSPAHTPWNAIARLSTRR